MVIDLTKLEMAKNHGSDTIARCPACAEAGHDRKGEHLYIYANGRFGCVIYPGVDGNDHRKRIFALVGIQKPTRPINSFIVNLVDHHLKEPVIKNVLGRLGHFNLTLAHRGTPKKEAQTHNDVTSKVSVPNVPKAVHVKAEWVENGKRIDAEVIRKLYHLGLEWNKKSYASVQDKKART